VYPDGKKLSKRTGAPGIRECMDMGLEPLAVVQHLASLAGALPTKTLFASLDDMARAFNPFALGRGNAVMNVEELKALSGRAFRSTDPAMLAQKLDEAVDPGDPWHGLHNSLKLEIVASLRENASSLRELRLLLPHFTQDETTFSVQALGELAANLPVLSALDQALSASDPASRLDAAAVSDLLRRTAEQAGVKGRHLYHPIRLALTGAQSGPELATLLAFLTVGRIRQRIQTVFNIFSHSNDKE
jgi:glutamyl-tRNA synthetase/nondiscriminating glutamyl-tRNA synthetase